MIDDILAGIFGELAFGRLNNSKRVQLILRMFFGFLGFTLAAIGCYHFATAANVTQNVVLKSSMIAVFVFLGSFSLFNVALGRQWRWPGRLFILSFISLFVVRILLGP